ncbi:NAD(P)/FAD-dependent oxidoreductase [Thalassolituus sp.]|uniref:NAD(P)/FAD-dependent oxidoreductase n=1 Tax=Thalassolituus sp. TaxID=2030822 RepID=UPI002A80A146|nr:NAD(P)/FAD-dependent oxidoreductase [Thalassolituus sp.]
MSSVDFDICVMGGGVIGLAIASALAKSSSVLLVEQHDAFGTETSSRNSEVIHAGLYYTPNSLKESLCLAGREALYTFCQQHDVPHQMIGKLIVAPDQNNPRLEALFQKALMLDIPIERLDQHALREHEPNVSACEALLSPRSGIIDSHIYMLRLAQEAERLGATLMKYTKFNKASINEVGWQVELTTSDGLYSLNCATLINAAGLHAHDVAQRCGTAIDDLPPLHFCRGHYFSYQGTNPFNHLIYPLPEANLTGLGIHATIDLGGQVRFGPDTEYLSATRPRQLNYEISTHLGLRFAKAIQGYFPELKAEQLRPAYAGIRPKLHLANEIAADFHIARHDRENTPPLVHLLGIESPGLTSSLAIGQYVTELLLPQN